MYIFVNIRKKRQLIAFILMSFGKLGRKCTVTYRGEKGIVADAGIVADNDISRTIIVIKK